MVATGKHAVTRRPAPLPRHRPAITLHPSVRTVARRPVVCRRARRAVRGDSGMRLPVALALVIGVIGAVITYLYVGPLGGLGLMVPATFIGAASYFAAGGDRAALTRSVPANVWGIVCGTVTLILLGLATSPIVVGVIVGGLTAVFILG